ncbi:hypothetical protein GYMLUDRAFT_997362 [Collybiopsis luxurians FD-317 M1]|uniref:Uncharacterized protein n=1 Tax=Collybiopsis luxurians FD-317 M1 TaxID=944289 RepID=A0A0D0CQZ6_9AGAR|nr:hypothetical protein GYMLUDRAFT_997362 [Collybiopsis luxurians FD-317 M1]
MFEGWIYFALALLEFLSHILTAVRDDLEVFRIVDIVLGAFSSLPLLFYTFFLCIFSWTYLMDAIPQWLQRLGKFFMVVLIPVVVGLNAVSSFIGITHRSINSTVEVGFSSPNDKTLWTFLTDFDIGFIVGYQILHFLFAFLRLAKAFLEQGRIESTEADEALLVRGTAWIVLGIKVGAIETAIAFVPQFFGTTLARRILRAVGRGSLVFGLLRGLDVAEDFQHIREEIQAGNKNRSFRGSRIRPLVSDRRLSALRQFSPEVPSRGAVLSPILEGDTPLGTARTVMSPGQRVAVLLDSSGASAPTLEMRFSALNMPSPADIVEGMGNRPELMSHSQRSSYYANSTMTRQTIGVSEAQPPSRSTGTAESPRQRNLDVVTHASNVGAQAGVWNSENPLAYSVVKDPTSQFTDLPPGVTAVSQQARQDLYIDTSLSSSPPKRSNSHNRKPAPRASLVLGSTSADPDAFEGEGRMNIPSLLESSEHAHQMGLALNAADSWAAAGSHFSYPPGSPRTSSAYSTSPTTGITEEAFKFDMERRTSRGSRAHVSAVQSHLPWVLENDPPESETHTRGKSTDTLASSRFQRPESEEYDVGYSEEPSAEPTPRRSNSGSRSSRSRRSRSAGRIKSVGQAPRRTPTLTQSSYARESVYIQPIFIPPQQGGNSNVELEQGTLNGSILSHGQAFRDSDVLGGSNESAEFHAI